MVNHYYFYCVDEDFGAFFIKFCSYFPYTGKLCGSRTLVALTKAGFVRKTRDLGSPTRIIILLQESR